MAFNKKIIEKIEFTDIHSAGKVVGKFKNRNIFVDFGIPGEIADIEIPRRVKQGNYTSGTILRLHIKSEEREASFCKYFGICGGCNWQHINYKFQLKLKRDILIKAFEKYCIKTPLIPEVIGSPKLKMYRNKSEYSLSDSALFLFNNEICKSNEPVLGFHLSGSHSEIIDINECYLQEFAYKIDYYELKFLLITWYKSNPGLLKSITIRTTTQGYIMLILNFDKLSYNSDNLCDLIIEKFPKIDSLYTCINSDNKFNTQYFHKFGSKLICETSRGLKFYYGPDSFYQPNPLQASNIYNQIVEFANFSGYEQVYDLYTGIGTIASVISKYVSNVVAIEGSNNAVENARANAKFNNINNVEFITGDILETFKPPFIEKYGKPDVIVLDPPRSGTLIEIKKTILWAEPEKIIYLSCNPVSLAWDLKQLSEKYEISKIQPFDMFPHTHHLETLVILELRK